MKGSQPVTWRKKKQKKFKQNKPTKAAPKPLVKNKLSWLSAISQKKIEEKVIYKKVAPQEKKPFFTFIKKYETDIQLFLIPAILFVIFLVLSSLNEDIARTASQNKLAPANVMMKVNDYPFVQNVQMPAISAKAGIVVNADSQVALYSKNPKLRFSMASTTKIMTALVGLDYYQDNALLTVQRLGAEGSSLGLLPGETFYFKDLLYAMLLPSANDAAYAIADNYPGGVDAFVARMNEKAALLHLSDTHFADPTGLDDDGNYTTVVDMARLASYAIKNKEFTEITATKKKVITTANLTQQYELNNLNKLLGKAGVYGIKTGTTEGAGEVLVTATVHEGHTFIIVVMNSQQRFVDTEILLAFIAQNVQYAPLEIHPETLLQR